MMHEELEGAGVRVSSHERMHVTLQALAGQERGYQGHLMIGYASISLRVPLSRLERPYTLLMLPLLPVYGDIRGATSHLPAGSRVKPRNPKVKP